MESAFHDLIDDACSLAANAAAGLQTEAGRRQAALAVAALALAWLLKLTLRLGWAGLRRLTVGEESALLAKLKEHLADPNATLTFAHGADELTGYQVTFRVECARDGRATAIRSIRSARESHGRDVYSDVTPAERKALLRCVSAALARVRERDRLESRRKSLEALNKA